MSREQKLALIIGFALVLVVGVVISDHLSRAREAELALVQTPEAAPGVVPAPTEPLAIKAEPASDSIHLTTPQGTRQYDPPVQHASAPDPTLPLQPAPESRLGSLSRALGADDTPATPESFRPLPPVVIDQRMAGARPSLFDQLGDVTGRVLNGEVPIEPAVQPRPTRTARSAPPVTTLPAQSNRGWVYYTVREGESLFAIARAQLGNGHRWKEIQSLNRDRVGADGSVRAGVRLKVPSSPARATARSSAPDRSTTDAPIRRVQPAAPSRSSTLGDDGFRRYTVKKGDTLGVIAQRELGTVRRMQEIMDLNPRDLKDPDDVRSGMVLKLPAK